MCYDTPLALFPTIGYQRLLCPENVEGSPIYPLWGSNHELGAERVESETAEEGKWRGGGGGPEEVQHQDSVHPVVCTGDKYICVAPGINGTI